MNNIRLDEGLKKRRRADDKVDERRAHQDWGSRRSLGSVEPRSTAKVGSGLATSRRMCASRRQANLTTSSMSHTKRSTVATVERRPHHQACGAIDDAPTRTSLNDPFDNGNSGRGQYQSGKANVMRITETARKNHEELFPNRTSTLIVTDPELIEVFDNFAFDEVLAFGNLDTRTRLMVILASMIASQALGEYRVMLGGALNVGVTPGRGQRNRLSGGALCGHG